MKLASPPPLPAPSSTRTYWVCQLVGWGGYALAQMQTAALFYHLPWLQTTLELTAVYGAALLLTHLLRDYMRRHRWHTLSKLALVPRVLLAGVVLGAPLGLAVDFMSVGVLNGGGSPDLPKAGVILGGSNTLSPPVLLLVHIVNMSGLIWFWTVVYFLVVGARRRREALLQHSEVKRALQSAELRLLKSQLNPHFLFNSLNSVRALIADDPSRAQDAVTQLARTLRYTLASGEEELVTLVHELEIVTDYLELESLRLAERLKIKLDIADAALHVRIPVMLLQTVVENAIKHGIAELPEGGVLHISAQVRDGTLMLSVENPRPSGATQRQREHIEGIGLRNSAQRLQLLFGAQASLDLDLSDPQRAVTRIRIPVSA